ncbi:MAG: TPM domain-containing protein [Candidatus Aminicenantes bacterium]|nr:TPM domain-containing protein [Candidatus Aminicenantes bacterium]MCK5003572.1 TPM domain-containing protein [Candidatus Aminicenantes bacterium]
MKKIILLILIIFIVTTLYPVGFPKLKGRVNDYANILFNDEERNIEWMLEDLEKKTSAQVVLLTIDTLDGDTIENYSIRLTEQEDWKIGQKGVDNGVILIISMKERKLRLEVGYGLEGALTDLKSSYIIRKLIVPGFKKGEYYHAILRGLTTVSGIISKEYDISPEDLKKFKEKKNEKQGFSFITFLIIFFFFVLPAFSKKRGKGGSIFWGGGGFGGSSSGGFGGFSGGGGSFGGGGASGGW